MMVSRREEFLRYARENRLINPKQPVRVQRELGWQPTLLSYEDGSKPTVVAATPVVYLTYITWTRAEGGVEPVMFREMFAGVVEVDHPPEGGRMVGGMRVELVDSFYDWLIANANEMTEGDRVINDYERVYLNEPQRELAYVVDRATSMVQKL